MNRQEASLYFRLRVVPYSPVPPNKAMQTDVLDLLAAGLSRDEVLEELPDLEPEDIEAAIRYASSRVDHPVVA
jgi:hypothetical protein